MVSFQKLVFYGSRRLRRFIYVGNASRANGYWGTGIFAISITGGISRFPFLDLVCLDVSDCTSVLAPRISFPIVRWRQIV